MTHSNALLVYFFAYFCLGFLWRSWRVWRLTGINPLVLPKRDDAHGYVGRAFKAVLLGLGMYLAALSLWGTEPFGIAEVPPALVWLGWGFLLLALGTTCWAQRDLGTSWRIGIDEGSKPALVQHGIYAHSRNPIFLAMRIALLGMLAVSPCAISLALALVGEVLMQIQVRLEEAFLAQGLGELYASYCARVPRWL